MNILLITPASSIKRTWGITKVVIDASEAMNKAGASCDLFPPHSIDPKTYESSLLEYLENTHGKYDVIEIPDTLRYAINPRKYAPLVVTRSVLLPLHRNYIHYPSRPTTFRSKIKNAFLKRQIQQRQQEELKKELTIVHHRLKEGHLINVANSMDSKVLQKEGYDPNSILVQPYGLNDTRFKHLNSLLGPSSNKTRTNLVFLGTFDFRKGCLDIVDVYERFQQTHPHARLSLLGTNGLMTSKQQVLSFFPKHLRQQIKIVESFSENDLPRLLEDSDIGIFPSYWEGFGISVVELLAAGIPVVAYNAPGPCDILPEKWLVSPGDTDAMLAAINELAENRDPVEAKAVGAKFEWTKIGKATVEAYRAALEKA